MKLSRSILIALNLSVVLATTQRIAFGHELSSVDWQALQAQYSDISIEHDPDRHLVVIKTTGDVIASEVVDLMRRIGAGVYAYVLEFSDCTVKGSLDINAYTAGYLDDEHTGHSNRALRGGGIYKSVDADGKAIFEDTWVRKASVVKGDSRWSKEPRKLSYRETDILGIHFKNCIFRSNDFGKSLSLSVNARQIKFEDSKFEGAVQLSGQVWDEISIDKTQFEKTVALQFSQTTELTIQSSTFRGPLVFQRGEYLQVAIRNSSVLDLIGNGADVYEFKILGTGIVNDFVLAKCDIRKLEWRGGLTNESRFIEGRVAINDCKLGGLSIYGISFLQDLDLSFSQVSVDSLEPMFQSPCAGICIIDSMLEKNVEFRGVVLNGQLSIIETVVKGTLKFTGMEWPRKPRDRRRFVRGDSAGRFLVKDSAIADIESSWSSFPTSDLWVWSSGGRMAYEEKIKFFTIAEKSFEKRGLLEERNRAAFSRKSFEYLASRNKTSGKRNCNYREREELFIKTVIHWLWGVPTGYGTKPGRLIGLLLLLCIGFGCLLTALSRHFVRIPDEKAAADKMSFLQIPHVVISTSHFQRKTLAPVDSIRSPNVLAASLLGLALMAKFFKAKHVCITYERCTGLAKVFVASFWALGFLWLVAFAYTATNSYPLLYKIVSGIAW